MKKLVKRNDKEKLNELLGLLKPLEKGMFSVWKGQIRNVSFENDCFDNDIMVVEELYFMGKIQVERRVEFLLSEVEQKEGVNTILLNVLFRKYDQFFLFPMGCNEENTQDGEELDVINIEDLYKLSRKVFCGFLGDKSCLIDELTTETLELVNQYNAYVELQIC